MIKIEQNARPFITDKPYLKHLTDIGVFEKQLDAWAFAVAFALRHNIVTNPEQETGKHEDVTEVDHLDRTTLDALLGALEAIKPEVAQQDSVAVIRELSKLASAGLAVIRQETEGHGINEVYEYLLRQSHEN